MRGYAVAALAAVSFSSGSLAYSQAEVTRPSVSEEACPLQVIEAPTRDGQKATAVVRKPPGKGPFPAVIVLHAGMGRKVLERGVESAKEASRNGQQYTRFLAAGYVTVNPMRRGSKRDPQSPDSVSDCLAVVESVKTMPEVDPMSVVIFGHSGGGSFALDLAGETPLCAIAIGESATVLFTGMLGRENRDLEKIMEDPRRYYTPELRKLTREKIARITCPILISQGDQHPINKVNNEVFIPELELAGKQVKVAIYPDQPHSFYFGSRETGDAGQRVFDDTNAFFKKHLPTQPQSLDEKLVKHVPVGRR